MADETAVRSYQMAFTFFQLPHGLLAVSLMTTFQPDLARAFVQGPGTTSTPASSRASACWWR